MSSDHPDNWNQSDQNNKDTTKDYDITKDEFGPHFSHEKPSLKGRGLTPLLSLFEKISPDTHDKIEQPLTKEDQKQDFENIMLLQDECKSFKNPDHQYDIHDYQAATKEDFSFLHANPYGNEPFNKNESSDTFYVIPLLIIYRPWG